MNVLFIEDIKNNVEMVRMLFEENEYNCEIVDFNNLEENLIRFQPDIIILDLMGGIDKGDNTGIAGKKSFNTIWDIHFCPIIIYSADPDLFQEKEHPFIDKVKKGKSSDIELLKKVKSFSSHIDNMAEIKGDVNKAVHYILRDLVPIVSKQIQDMETQKRILQHMGRRRLAAQLDNMAMILEKQIYPWEQYIFPPIDKSPKLGDIIRKKSSDVKDPESYRLILTPSCDLVCSENQSPKVKEVLCAKCFKVDVLFEKPVEISKKSGKLTSKVLSQGFINEFLPLPGFDVIFPAMVANLKEKELIGYNEINNDKSGEYIRIVSIDSPFREQIAWAYLNTAARPGVPERNFKLWEEQYLDLVKPKK